MDGTSTVVDAPALAAGSDGHRRLDSPVSAPRVKESTDRTASFLAQLAGSLGIRISAAGLTFLVGLLCARVLGPESFGEYAVATGWMSLLVVVGKLGFDTATLRFLAQYRSQGDVAALRGFLQVSRRYSLIASLLTASALVAAAMLLRHRLSPTLLTSLMLTAGLIPVMAGIQLREASLIAVGRVFAGQTNGVLTPLLLIMSLLVVRSVLPGPPSWAAVLLHLGCALVTLSVLAAVCGRSMRTLPAAAPDVTVSAQWTSVAIPLLAIQLLNLIQHQSGTLMCGMLLDTTSAGVYAAAARVASVLFLGLQAVNLIAAPRLSAMYHAGQMDALHRYLHQCTWAGFGIALGFTLLVAIGGRQILELFGPEFAGGYVPMLIIVAGLAIASAAGPVSQLLYMTGHERPCLVVLAVNGGLYLLMGLVLIPRHGLVGAAEATALARVGAATAMLILARRRLGMWPPLGLRAPATRSATAGTGPNRHGATSSPPALRIPNHD